MQKSYFLTFGASLLDEPDFEKLLSLYFFLLSYLHGVYSECAIRTWRRYYMRKGEEMSADMEVILGPPGTGKTTELARLARQYAEEEGSDSLLLCAYTKTASGQLAGQDMEIERRQIGTLHALCFHALDYPHIAETHYNDWNATHRLYPLSSPQSMTERDFGATPTLRGDTYLNALNIVRHRLVPASQWPLAVRAFAHVWNAWKYDNGYSDFTDLLEVSRTLLPVAPGNPATIIVDEAQDLSLLQWALLSQWAQHAKRLIAAGDDEQCLYRWAGADFTPLLQARMRRILGQSYRVPRLHQSLALQHSAHIRRKEPKVWHPRGTNGVVLRDSRGWHDGDYWARRCATWLEDPSGTVTYLVSCAYMLQSVLVALRAQGIPFGNPWRRARHDWNPLVPPARGTGMVQRLLDFLRPQDRLWTWNELATWLPYLIRAEGVLTHGAKAIVALRAGEKGECALGDLKQLFLPTMIDGALRGGLDWLEGHTLQSHAQALAYPCRVYKRYGREVLTTEPRIRVGTAHSFKGTESDTVVQFTALSRSQQVAMCSGGDSADDVYRMLYVASTRSRERLILAGPYQSHMGPAAQQRPQPCRVDDGQESLRVEVEEDSEAF